MTSDFWDYPYGYKVINVRQASETLAAMPQNYHYTCFSCGARKKMTYFSDEKIPKACNCPKCGRRMGL